MTTRKDKKFKYGEAMRFIARPPSTIPKEEKKKIVSSFYKDPIYSDDYLDLAVPIEELEDIKQQLNVSPMVRIKKPDLRSGLPNILLADASNKPPTLEDYLRLGLSLAQLSDEERKNIQWMLDRSKPKGDK